MVYTFFELEWANLSETNVCFTKFQGLIDLVFSASRVGASEEKIVSNKGVSFSCRTKV